MDVLDIHIISSKDPGADTSFTLGTITVLSDEEAEDGKANVSATSHSMTEVQLFRIAEIIRGAIPTTDETDA